MKKYLPLYLLFIIAATGFFSCVDSPAYENGIYSATDNVQIRSFSLAKNDSVLANLDSVFFTIDLVGRRVFNADSLPVGTDITQLVANIEFDAISEAKIHVTGGKLMKDTILDYGVHSGDSIDFTGKVVLSVVSVSGETKANYDIEVRVHKMKPDSLWWNELARTDLPSTSAPIEQHTVRLGKKAVILMRTANGFEVSSTENPADKDSWVTKPANIQFTPFFNSLRSTDDALFIIDTAGNLYTSVDGTEWTSTGDTKYRSLLGSYNGIMHGVKQDGTNYYHATYPATKEYPLEETFPVVGASDPMDFTTMWSISHQMLIFGGRDATGRLRGNVWGFDGENWGRINTHELVPGVEGSIMIPYTGFKVAKDWTTTKYSTLLIFGGRHSDMLQEFNLISYTYGKYWDLGDENIQFPEYLKPMVYGQALIFPVSMSAELSPSQVPYFEGWESYPSKKLPVWCFPITARNVMSARAEITWECPYIYIFGGTDMDGVLYNNIWKGVINRLSFKPLI